MPEIKKFHRTIIQKGIRIGAGGQGEVFKVNHEIQGTIAVKLFSSGSKIANLEKKEIEHLINHNSTRFIVRFLGLVVDEWDNCIGHVTDFMEGGSLHNVIHNGAGYQLKQAYSWIEEAAYGLSFLHDEKIIHRDVKPLNMLLSDNHKSLKICDLGFSRHFEDVTSTCGGGTWMYMSPESISFQKEKITFTTDVWSLGISIWEILKRRMPYGDKNLSVFALHNLIIQGKLVPEWKGNSDKEVGDLLKRMWKMDPEDRPTMLEIRKFFTDRKTTCSDRRIQPPKKGKTDDSSAGLGSLSISEPSTSSSTNSSLEEPKPKQQTSKSKKYYDQWLETSQSFIAMSAQNPELNDMCTKMEDAAKKMQNLNLKKKEDAVQKCLEFVRNCFAEIVAYINGPAKKIKDAQTMKQLEMMKTQTESVQRQFEIEVTKKLNSLSEKSLTKSATK